MTKYFVNEAEEKRVALYTADEVGKKSITCMEEQLATSAKLHSECTL